MITAVNTVALYVADQQRARDFYVDQVGFEVRRDADMGDMGRWLEVAPVGARTSFVLADADGFGKQDQIGHSADVTLSSGDIRELHRRLAESGVTVTDPEVQEWGTFLRFTDPDGHTFLVSETK